MYVLVINLDRSPERLVSSMAELARIGLSATRVPAVDGRLLELDASGNLPGYKKRGRAKEHYYRGTAGCYYSHIRALQEALRANEWPCLIVEDDILIQGDDPLMLPDTSKDIIFFGGLDDTAKGLVYGGHAICYRTRDAAMSVLDWQTKHPGVADLNITRLHSLTDCCHYERPYRIWQRDGYSLIQEREMRRFSSKNPDT